MISPSLTCLARATSLKIILFGEETDSLLCSLLMSLCRYYWQSYRDIIDVNYLGKGAPVENVYGVKSDKTVWEKIDHCGFPDGQVWTTCNEAVDLDIRECASHCGSKYGCNGVLLAPVILPDSVHADFKDDHPIPWGDTGKKDERYPNAGYRSGYKNQTIRCMKEDFPLLTKQTHVCVGIKSRSPTETAEGHHIAEDPRDPMWYSTYEIVLLIFFFFLLMPNFFFHFDSCFIPKKIITFDTDPPAPKRVPLRWRYADHCVDCELAYNNSFVANRRPIWKVADKCVDCDKVCVCVLFGKYCFVIVFEIAFFFFFFFFFEI